MAKIPARYVGQYPISLNMRAQNIDGTPRASMQLSNGDEILMPDTEVLGETYIFDPRGQRDPIYLGAGHVVRDEDKGKTDQELSDIGYQFSLGRPDFEVVQDQQKGQ